MNSATSKKERKKFDNPFQELLENVCVCVFFLSPPCLFMS